MGFIYKLTLKKESRKAYIGQTIRDIHKHLEEHQQLRSSRCRAIYNAIKKYGWENFDVEWYEVPDEELNFYEEMLVALLGPLAPGGYNLMEGGGSKGRPSEESKQKMSEAQKGKTHTEEAKQKMSEAQKGKMRTEEHKQKLREANLGKTHTEKTKKKMRETHTGKEHTEETKKKMSEAKTGEKNKTSKCVYQYTIDGTYVDSYGSSGEAARALGKTDGSSICSCARGKRPTAYGFKWTREKF